MAATKSLGALLKAKGGFMASVIGIMVFQLAITFGVFYALRTQAPEWAKEIQSWWLSIVIVQLLLLLAMMFVPLPVAGKLVLFTLFSASFGLLWTVFDKVPAEVVTTALIGTIGIFVAMFLVGVALAASGTDLGWTFMYLMAALVGVIIAMIVMLFIPVSSTARKVVACIVIVLFAVLIVFDTNMILLRDYEDPVSAAMDYYLDFINIFWGISGLGEA